MTDVSEAAAAPEPVDDLGTEPTVDVAPPTDDGSATFRWWVAAAVAVGLVVRVAWVWWGHRTPWTDHGFATYDPARYLQYADQIGRGRGYTSPFRIQAAHPGAVLAGQATAYYPPGYPWFLGIVDWIARLIGLTHHVVLVAELVQAALGAATAAFGAIVARRLAGVRAGIVAAFGLALYPNLVFHTGVLLGETLYDFLFLAFLAVICARPWPEGLTNRRVVAASVPFALAIMVRPISLALLPFLFLIWWRAQGGLRVPLRHLGLLALVLAAAVVPWTIRNEIRMHGLVLLSTNTGDNLCMGHSRAATGKFTVAVANDPCAVRDEGVQYGATSEIKADKAKQKIAFTAITSHPGREPWLMWRRVYFTFIRDGDHDGVVAAESYRHDRWLAIPTEARLFRIADIAYWLTCAVGVAGLIRLTLSRRPDAWLLVSSVVVTAVVPLAFFGDSRFKVPVMALLVVAAACAPFRPRRPVPPL